MSKPEITEEGKERLLSVVNDIERYPKTFMIDNFGWEYEVDDPRDFVLSKKPLDIFTENCGTPMCIAGHIVRKYGNGERLGTDYAAELVGIKFKRHVVDEYFEAAYKLFFEFEFNGVRVNPLNVRARVEHWLETGE